MDRLNWGCLSILCMDGPSISWDSLSGLLDGPPELSGGLFWGLGGWGLWMCWGLFPLGAGVGDLVFGGPYDYDYY